SEADYAPPPHPRVFERLRDTPKPPACGATKSKPVRGQLVPRLPTPGVLERLGDTPKPPACGALVRYRGGGFFSDQSVCAEPREREWLEQIRRLARRNQLGDALARD